LRSEKESAYIIAGFHLFFVFKEWTERNQGGGTWIASCNFYFIIIIIIFFFFSVKKSLCGTLTMFNGTSTTNFMISYLTKVYKRNKENKELTSDTKI
jgi:hypothetical protein